MSLRLKLLGAPQIVWEGQHEPLSLNKPTLLLLYLACRGSKVSRSELAFLFRADAPEKIALAHLRKLIHRAKQYPWAQLDITPTHLCMSVETDLLAFKRAVQQKHWQTALAVYQGRLLDGFSADDVPAYSAWLELERHELELTLTQVLYNRIQVLETQNNLAEAITLAKELCQREPYDEDFLQLHLRLLHKDMRSNEALNVYSAFCNTLKTDLEAEPLESTKALVDSFAVPAHSFKAQKPRNHNLPAQTTRFFGRRQELMLIAERMAAEDCRLLTLVGLGGTGKTRLSLEYAKSHLGKFRDGVFFIPLAGVTHKQALLSATAKSLGFKVSGADALDEQLLAYIGNKELLLLVDNFEQLKAEAPLLDTMIGNCPNLRLLVTSREALELQSEWLIDVYGLSYPKADDDPRDFDAVKLFLNRAERIAPHLVRTQEALDSTADITRFTEGMPLALELAASWTRSLAAKDIAKTLHTNLHLLSSSYQNLPNRQRSMATVFDTSFAQLGEPEQLALSKLAIFEGSFDLEAAETVAGAHLALLMHFMNRSLVRRSDGGRYSIHELLRQYLAAKQVTDKAALEKLYSSYYLSKLANTIRALHGAKPQETIAQLLQDIDNIRKSYKLAANHHLWIYLLDAHTGLRALMARTGRWQESKAIFSDLLTNLEATQLDADGERLKLVTELSLSFTHWFITQNTYEIDKARYERYLTQEQNPEMQIELLFHIAHHDEIHGDFATAEEEFLRALELAKETNNTIWQGAILERLSDTPWLRGDYAQAAQYAREWLELSEASGETTFIVAASLTLHNRLTIMGDPEAASDALLQKALSYKDEVTLKSQALIFQGLGLYESYQGDYKEGVSHLKTSLELFSQTTDKRTAALVAVSLAKALKELERFDEASDAVRQSMNLFDFPGLQLGRLGEIERHRGNLNDAKTYLIQSLEAYLSTTQPVFVLLEAFISLALIYTRLNDLETALELAGYVFHHSAATAPQKAKLQSQFKTLKNPAKLSEKPVDELVEEQIKKLKTLTF